MLPPSAPDPEPPREEATSFLARRAHAGDAASFASLYERIGPSLYAWARLRIRPSIVGRLDPEDVAQEVWCRAASRFETFDPASRSFRAWIFAIAKLVLLEAVRGTQRREFAGAGRGASEQDLAALAADATSISRRAARDERIVHFVQRVASLPEAERQLLVHCGFEGLTAVETATRLGSTPEAVKKRWQRLRRRLESDGMPESLLD